MRRRRKAYHRAQLEASSSDSIAIGTLNVANDPADETLVVTLTNASTAKGDATVVPRAVTTNFVPKDTVTVSVNGRSVNRRGERRVRTFTVTMTGGATTTTPW